MKTCRCGDFRPPTQVLMQLGSTLLHKSVPARGPISFMDSELWAYTDTPGRHTPVAMLFGHPLRFSLSASIPTPALNLTPSPPSLWTWFLGSLGGKAWRRNVYIASGISVPLRVYVKRLECRCTCRCSEDCFSLGLSKIPLESSSGCVVFLFEKRGGFFLICRKALQKLDPGVLCSPPSHFLESWHFLRKSKTMRQVPIFWGLD